MTYIKTPRLLDEEHEWTGPIRMIVFRCQNQTTPGPRTSLEIYFPSLVLGRKLPFLGTTTSFLDLRLMRLFTLGLLKCGSI